MELRTERLRPRRFRAEDVDAYAEMCADREVARFLTVTGEPLSRHDAWRQMAMFVGHWELRGYGMWAAEERSIRVAERLGSRETSRTSIHGVEHLVYQLDTATWHPGEGA